MTELVDTSALIVAQRNEAARSWLRAALARDAAAICDIVALEYLTGARTADEYAALESSLRALPWLSIEPADWNRALEVHHELARVGPGHQRSVRLPDLVIAAVAERSALPVVHYDADYDRIAGVTGQSVRWIVPRGSV